MLQSLTVAVEETGEVTKQRRVPVSCDQDYKGCFNRERTRQGPAQGAGVREPSRRGQRSSNDMTMPILCHSPTLPLFGGRCEEEEEEKMNRKASVCRTRTR